MKKITGYRFFIKNGKEFFPSIAQALNSYFGFTKMRHTHELKVTRTINIEQTVNIPQDIIDRMKIVDRKLTDEKLSPFYDTRIPYKRNNKNPYFTYKDFIYVIGIIYDSESSWYDYNKIIEYKKCVKLRELIEKNNIDARVTNSNTMVTVWFKNKKDVAKFKLLYSGTLTNIVDVSDIGKIEEDIDNLFENL